MDYAKGYIDESGTKHVTHVMNDSEIQKDQKLKLNVFDYIDKEDDVKLNKQQKEVIIDMVADVETQNEKLKETEDGA